MEYLYGDKVKIIAHNSFYRGSVGIVTARYRTQGSLEYSILFDHGGIIREFDPSELEPFKSKTKSKARK